MITSQEGATRARDKVHTTDVTREVKSAVESRPMSTRRKSLYGDQCPSVDR